MTYVQGTNGKAGDREYEPADDILIDRAMCGESVTLNRAEREELVYRMLQRDIPAFRIARQTTLCGRTVYRIRRKLQDQGRL
jgi:hypothetical protein